MKNEVTHQIGDRVKVLHNIPLGNLIGTVKAIHQRPKHDVYEVELDGGGTDSLYGFQLERITDTPETDAVREMWFISPNVELGDGRPIHGNVVDVEFARKMERQRNEAREAYETETLTTADLMAENMKLSYALHQIARADMIKWDANTQEEFEREFTPWAQKIANDALASESQREAAGLADDNPDGQAENAEVSHTKGEKR